MKAIELERLAHTATLEIFTAKGSRLTPAANYYDEVDVIGGLVSIQAIDGIVGAVLEADGFRPVSDPASIANGRKVYARVRNDQTEVIAITWDPSTGTFNPKTGFSQVELPVFPQSVIAGPAFGVNA